MKSIIRQILQNSLVLWLTSVVFKGLVVTDTLQTVLLGGIVLFAMNFTIKPILNLVALPLNILTLGGISWVINAFILYLLTILIPSIKIVNFTFEGASLFGVVLPRYDFTLLTGIIAASFIMALITTLIKWLIA